MPSRLFSLLLTLSGFVMSMGNAFAADEGKHAEHHALSPDAPVLFSIPLPGNINIPFTNSMVMLFAAICLLTVIIRLGTKKMTLIPGGVQNFLEMVYEMLFNFFVGIMGEKMTKRTFWFMGTAFILILTSNWMGLIPGVGIITYTNDQGVTAPIFRGANADLNATLAMGFIFAILWFYWVFSEIGVKGFLKDTFAPKGTFKGIMLYLLIPIFLMVGLIDILSILLRPITLGARLYGNVFAGEQIVETMSNMTKNPLMSWMPVIPFYFMELLVGLLQAFVFCLLSAVFIGIICNHPGEEEHS